MSSETRNWAMGAHLSAFLGAWVALAFVGPLVVWLVKREDHPFIDHHAKEALNFNLTILVAAVAAVVLSILTLGIGVVVVVPVAAVVAVGWIVLTIVASIKAVNGEGYRYPLTIRFVR